MITDLSYAISALEAGGIIVYPTESVFGLGCDPFNEKAVNILLRIKQRDVGKGLILLASDWEQLGEFVQPIDAKRMAEIQSIPNTTWLFPKTDRVPAWIHGDSDQVAVRVTSHPLAKKLCQQFGKPIVSTSANLSGEPPVKIASELNPKLLQQVDVILEDETGELTQPTTIIDAVTNRVIR